jgi:hypothetical protein
LEQFIAWKNFYQVKNICSEEMKFSYIVVPALRLEFVSRNKLKAVNLNRRDAGNAIALAKSQKLIASY